MENTGLVFKLFTDLTNFQSGLKKASKDLDGVNKMFGKIGGAIAGAFTVGSVIAFGNAAITAFDESAKAEQRLRTALGGNENAVARLTAEAAKLQNITLFDDDASVAAYAFLSTIKLSEDSIKKLLPVIQDFATVQGMDLVSATELVGKSIMGTRNALKPYGIALDKTKTAAEQVDQAVAGLNERFGGQAKAAAEVGSASITQMGNAFSDFMEVVGGGTMNTLDPFFKGMTSGLRNMTEYLKQESIPWWQKMNSILNGSIVVEGQILREINAKNDASPKGKLEAARENLELLRSQLQQEIASRNISRQDLQERLAGEKKNVVETGLLNDLKNKIVENEKLIAGTYSVQHLAYLRQQNEALKMQMDYYNSIGTSLAKMTPKGAGQITVASASPTMQERTGAVVNTDYGNDAPSLVELQATAEEASALLSTFREDILSTAAEGFGLLISGDMGMGDFFNSILMLTADFAKQFGKLLISIGLAKVSLEKIGISGIGAVIAGFALVAAASAMSSFLSNQGSMQGLATGTNYVPQEGQYYLHKGEAVVPEKYNPSAGGIMPGMVRVTGTISGRDIRLTQAREGYYNSRTTGR